METDRLKELANYIRTYATSIETLSKSMNQVEKTKIFDDCIFEIFLDYPKSI